MRDRFSLRWTLTRKLALSGLLLIGLLASVGGMAVLSQVTMVEQAGSIARFHIPLSQAVARIRVLHRRAHDAAVSGGQLQAALSELGAGIVEALALFQGETAAESPGSERLEATLLALRDDHGDLLGLSPEETQTGLAAMEARLDTLTQQIDTAARDALQSMEEEGRTSLNRAAALAGISLLVGVLLLVWVVARISLSARFLVQELTQVTQAVRSDVIPQSRLEVESTDEIGLVASHINALMDAFEANLEKRNRLSADLLDAQSRDDLTGALRPVRFRELAGVELERSRRYGGSVSLILIDVDDLKEVNINHGFETGDYVIRALASTVRDSVRKTDAVGRWSGGTLAILVPETSLEGGRYVGEKLRRNVEVHPLDAAGHVTVSVGVACFNGEEEVDGVMARAERALDRAKRAGGNRVEEDR